MEKEPCALLLQNTFSIHVFAQLIIINLVLDMVRDRTLN